MQRVELHFPELDTRRLQALCGADNYVLKQLAERFGVRFLGAPGRWTIEGEQAATAADIMRKLAERGGEVSRAALEGMLKDRRLNDAHEHGHVIKAGRRHVRGKTPNQRRYIEMMASHVLTLAVGPAGSGKTYLAVAAAVEAMLNGEVERIVLTRPAVEAGERLGFLPGDMQQKVDPYLRPLFDALADMLGIEKMNALLESGRIEVAPLAYMRGRTLNDAFIILDEAQNTTREQMKMFLTRLGFGARMVVTGDITQIDLPNHRGSGLSHALQVLDGIKDVAICRLSGCDVVRHRLVERIVDAYERHASPTDND
ncbi:MAG: PhoH family protein [Zetaproteobacteria bacterium]|nr:MAG: PhoH family protein [Zetaproteobacteria bacterium]